MINVALRNWGGRLKNEALDIDMMQSQIKHTDKPILVESTVKIYKIPQSREKFFNRN
jgi:hypothetical protein